MHLEPHGPPNKQCKIGHSIMKKCDMQTVKTINKVNTSNNLAQLRPKRNIKAPVKLNLYSNSRRSEKLIRNCAPFCRSACQLVGQKVK